MCEIDVWSVRLLSDIRAYEAKNHHHQTYLCIIYESEVEDRLNSDYRLRKWSHPLLINRQKLFSITEMILCITLILLAAASCHCRFSSANN